MQALLSSARAQSAAQPSAEQTGIRDAPDFAYIVSHDLATEFRHVAEFAKILRSELPPNIGATADASLQYLSDAAERCQLMLGEVRLYSRVQSRPLTLASCHAQDLVYEAILQLSGELNEAGVIIECAVLGDIVVDAALFVEALRRIIDNAVRHSLQASVPRVEISGGHDAEGAWRLYIRDHGPGLAPPYRAQAFAMFWQLDRSEAPAGVGAGLPIARAILARHDGDIAFVDCERGACVEVALRPWTIIAPERGGLSFGERA